MVSDKELMLFKDCIQSPDPPGWVTVSGLTDCERDSRFVFSALASPGSVGELLKDPSHEVNPSWFGIPTFAKSEGRVSFEPNNSYREVGIYLEPFVFERDFHGARPGASEVVQDLAMYHDLFLDQGKKAYVDLAGEQIVRVPPSGMQVSEKALRDYLAARQMILVLYYDHRRWLEASVSELAGKERLDLYPEAADAKYRIVAGDAEDGGGFSMLLGKRVVRPYAEPRHRDYVSALDSPKRYETYECVENGEPVEKSCRAEPGRPPTPVFFKRKVLKRYHDSSLCDVHNGTIWHLDLWYIGFRDNGETVRVWLEDLGMIPHREQLHWKSFNDMPRHPPEIVEAKSECERLLGLRARTNENFERRFGFKLFKELPSGKGAIGLHDPVSNEESEFNEQILNMAKIFVDGIDGKRLARNAQLDERGKSISNLRQFLTEKGLEPSVAEKIAAGFRTVQSLRSTAAAHLRGGNYERDLRRFGLGEDPRDRFVRVAARLRFLLERLDGWLEGSSWHGAA